ncbi:YeeE/YedE family protein [Stappia stellulata]|uniref:YeeE/YedE family protein n=1 Tax=Stappia stellulata TaxID=71235 RepID=UPI00040D2248|nr:YeeE/YedE family protein [Stappia stellulata]
MDVDTAQTVAIYGFAGGLVLGLAARVGRFCTMGALEDAFLGGDKRRLRSWALAIAVATALSQALAHLGILDFHHSIYLSSGFPWLGAVLGGMMFGVGMALVGTCGYGTLARIGGGDLRAVVTFLVMAVSAYMAMRGLTGVVRQAAIDPWILSFEATGGMALDGIFDAFTGLDTGPAIGLLIAASLAFWALKDASFRAETRLVVSGVAVGLAIVGGWLATGLVGSDPFAPQRLESFTFVRPLGDTLVYMMTFSGATVTFGIGSVVGVVAGAIAGALFKREFRWEACDDVRELRRHIVGAFLMGTGGVMAYGCTIGQGITAASTLSVSAPVVMISIAIGARAGLAWLIEGSLRGILAAHAFSRDA